MTSTCRGVSVIEVLVGLAILAMVATAATHTVGNFLRGTTTALERTQAMYLAQEGIELVHFLRDDDWHTVSGLTLNTRHYLDVSTTSVAFTGTPETINKFERFLVVEEVRRDSDDDIATAGGTVDDGSRFVTATVVGPTATATVSTLLTNIHDI